MQKIIFATTNQDKVRELNEICADTNFKLIPQSEFNIEEVPETGLTFVENALIKARHASKQTNMPAIADDSGIEVDALDGRPGIYSARFAGEQCSYLDNRHKLLKDLENIPKEKRTARFQSVLVFLKSFDDPTPIICQGTWEGVILDEARGDNGFGYDPIFFVPEYNMTSSQLSEELKNKLSARGQAVNELIKKLTAYYNS